MAIDLKKARDYVYANGTLWERALFAYLFQDGALERLHQCLLCHKNPDGGWGHALEHDIRTPDLHPLALEFLLTMTRDTGMPVGNILDGSAAWLEQHRNADGSFTNPASVLDYPHAPWWQGGGQTIPDLITGNLTRLGLCSPSLAASTRKWVESNLTLEKIAANEWVFMAYHAHDYFMFVDDFPNVDTYRKATMQNLMDTAERVSEAQYYHLFHYAAAPDQPATQHLPKRLLDRNLDYLASTQRDDGAWSDEHGLQHWFPYVTIFVLFALKNHGRVKL